MDIVLRGLVIYAFLVVVLRISGARSLAQTTAFDFVLLIIIAEAVAQALLGEDFSMTNALVLVVVLVGADVGLSLVKEYVPTLARLTDGLPVVLVEHGRPVREHMDRARVDEEDILAAARQTQGLRRMEDIDFAVLELGGAISIIPKRVPDREGSTNAR